MVSAGRSRVWLRIGPARIRADRITAVTTDAETLLLRVTGDRDPVTLPLPGGADPDGTGRPGVEWADELLRIIEYAAQQPAGTLISYTPATTMTLAGFTIHSLTDDSRPLLQPALQPLPDTLTTPRSPVPATWTAPRSNTRT
ncbi:hypothetical protein [Streptomyces sp. NPDC058701]|uniref:hypothetical protein n=1 Tax=Streptomyces sp. NPDC058701 TaxID=3346608 RepID=UPI003655892E